MLMSGVEFHVLCVKVGLDLGCHVVIGIASVVVTLSLVSCSVSPRRRNAKYRVLSLWMLQSTFALAVRLYFVIVKFHL